MVTASSIAPGGVVPSGELIYTATFSEDLDASDLNADDVRLRFHFFRPLFVAPSSFHYNPATRGLTVGFADLVEGTYTLTLLSGPTAFRDRAGNPLNGAPGFPLPSGQDDPATDPFAVDFIVDTATAPFSSSLVEVPPEGSLIGQLLQLGGTFHAQGDVDARTIGLDAGQTLTAIVNPNGSSNSILVQVELLGPDGASLGSTVSPSSLAPAVLQSVPVAREGTYTIVVTNLGEAIGYSIELLLNAAAESEPYTSHPNDRQDSAEDLDAGFISLGGAAERGAVTGQITDRLVTTFFDRFDAGLAGHYSTYSSTAEGRVRAGSEFSVDSGSGALLLDTVGFQPTLNEAVLTVNLSGADRANLAFYHHAFNDTAHPFGGGFVDHDNADGIAISADGIHWSPIWNAPDTTAGTWQFVSLDLADAARLAGISLGSPLRIKFQQFGDQTLPVGGRAWDDIHVSASVEDEDWYRFHLDPGQAATLASTSSQLSAESSRLELYDATGTLLATADAVGTNVTRVIPRFVAPKAGSYFARVLGDDLTPYSLVVTRGADFEVEPNDSIGTAQDVGPSGVVLGRVGGSSGSDDFYRVSALAGDTLSISTTTPGGGPLTPANPLVPALKLLDPDGSLIAVDDDPGGGHAPLSYRVPRAGTYTVRVSDRIGLGEGGAYVLTMVRDTTSLFLGPLEARGIAGGRVRVQNVTGSLTAGGSSGFTIDLDPGQTATLVLRPHDGTLQGRLDLLGPDGASLGLAAAAAAGQAAILQTIPVTAAGEYRVGIRALAGAGGYEVQLILNSAQEAEVPGGPSNDAVATAQAIDASALPLPGTADRLAVWGVTEGGTISMRSTSPPASTPAWR